MNRRTIGYFVLGGTLLVALMLLSAATMARGGTLTQGDATAQQQTIEAMINQGLTQTADVMLLTQAPTLTAALEGTVMRGIQLTQTAVEAYPVTQTAEFEATAYQATRFFQATALQQTQQAYAYDAAATAYAATFTAYNMGMTQQAAATATTQAIQTQQVATATAAAATATYESATPIPQPVTPMTVDNRSAVRQLAVLDGHSSGINALAFNADGTRLASASDDGTVRIWELRRGTTRLMLPISASFQDLALSMDGTLLAAASGTDGGIVFVWDAITGTTVITLSHTGVYSLYFWSDGTLTTVSQSEFITWDVRRGEMIAVEAAEAVGVVDDEYPSARNPWDAGLRAYAEQNDDRVFLRDTSTDSARTFLGSHNADIRTLRFSPDGRWLASGDDSGVIVLWGIRDYAEDDDTAEPLTIATLTPTSTATITPTFEPSLTPTPVLAPVVSLTPTPTTDATAVAWPFTASPAWYTMHTGAEGCQWLSIAGWVTDLNGQPLPDLAVEIASADDTFRMVVFSGSAAVWGPSGFEAVVGSAPRAATFTVRVLSPTGLAASEFVPVETGDTCQTNVAIVEFVQVRPY
ncbi:MAG: hypothetical protein GYB65_06715 [Chloroflexi bacterium]|nr:hypothetical protein [Chloroflexota bacterium]